MAEEELWFRVGTFHSGTQLTLLPPASGSREVAAGVWQRERERGWGAYSGSRRLTTRKEQGEAAGAEPQAQAGQPRRGWAGAVRPGTLIAFGAWERPQRRGGGEAKDPGSAGGPSLRRAGSPSRGRTARPLGFGVGDRRTRTPGFAVPSAGRRLETPSSPLPARPLGIPGAPGRSDFRTPSP